MFEFKMNRDLKYFTLFRESRLKMILGTKPSVPLDWYIGPYFMLICGGSSDCCEAELRQKIIIDAINV